MAASGKYRSCQARQDNLRLGLGEGKGLMHVGLEESLEVRVSRRRELNARKRRHDTHTMMSWSWQALPTCISDFDTDMHIRAIQFS